MAQLFIFASIEEVEKLRRTTRYMALVLMSLHPAEFDTPFFRGLCQEIGIDTSTDGDLDKVLAELRRQGP